MEDGYYDEAYVIVVRHHEDGRTTFATLINKPSNTATHSITYEARRGATLGDYVRDLINDSLDRMVEAVYPENASVWAATLTRDINEATLTA